MTTRRRSWGWLLAAAVLLALGAWLMLGAEPPPRPPPPYVSLPRWQTKAEERRAEERRTFLPLAQDAGVMQAAQPPQRPRDPLLSMMPSNVERGAVVAEVNAIFNSELGGLMFDCLTAGGSEGLTALRDAGFDPLVHLDRVAVIDDVVVMTGQLERLPVPAGALAKDYGPRAKVLELTGQGFRFAGQWRNQLLVLGMTEAQVTGMLDRLERPEPEDSPVLDESQAYGEVYGVIGSEAVADLFGEEEPRLRDVILEATGGVWLHADVSHDVGVVADVAPTEGAKTEELRKSIGSLLSLARLRAQRAGRSDEANLLELARVRAGGSGRGGFRVEAGAPHDLVKGMLERCVDRRKQRAAERAARRDAGE